MPLSHHSLEKNTVLHPFHWQIPRLVLCTYCNKHGCARVSVYTDLEFVQYTPMSGVVGSYGNSVFSFRRHINPDIHDGCTSMYTPWNLSFSVWLISLNMMTSSCIYLSANAMISFSFISVLLCRGLELSVGHHLLGLRIMLCLLWAGCQGQCVTVQAMVNVGSSLGRWSLPIRVMCRSGGGCEPGNSVPQPGVTAGG